MDVYFELHCMVPGALSEAYATFRFYARQLEDALKSMQCTMETAAEQTEKEAA